jgi:hypothetical protein
MSVKSPSKKKMTSFEVGIKREAHYKYANGSYSFQNPIYNPNSEENKLDFEEELAFDMRLKDFLVSIPSFQDFSEQQLLLLERRATVVKFRTNEVLFRQGQDGDVFYVCHSGSVDILIQVNTTCIY